MPDATRNGKIHEDLFSSAHIGVFRTNLNGDIISANNAFARMFEFNSVEEFAKEGIMKRWANPEKREDYLRQLKKKGRLENYEFNGFTKTGKSITLLGTIILEGDELSCVAIDITDRKKAEEALLKSEERYQLAESVTKIGTWDWNILTGALAWSETIEPLFGFGRGEFGATYEAFLRVVHPDDRQRVIDAVNACVEKGSDYHVEHRIVWPDRSVHWVLETGNVIRENGKAVRMLGVVQDITARKKAEEHVVYQAHLLTNVSDAIIATDTELKITSWNPAAERMFGWRKEEVLGKPVNQVVRSELTKQQYTDALEEMQKGTTYSLQLSVRHKDGHQIWNDSTNTVLRDSSGKVIGYISVNRDMTGLKKAEDSLQHEKEFSENILRTIPYGMDIVDENLRIVYMNKALQDAFGKDIIGKKCYEVYRSDGKQCENCPLKSGLNGSTEALEVSGIKNNKTFLISHTSILMNGQKRVLEIFSDITERKQMEESLLKLSRVVEQSHASIVITDTEGTIEYVNPHFTNVTGYSPEEIIGQNPRILKSGFQPREVYKEMWDTIKSGRDWQGEFCNKKKSGELYWELVSVSPVKDTKGKVIRFVAIKEDITNIKKAEEEHERLASELKKEKDILDIITENTEAHLAYLDTNFNFVSVNQTYAKGSGHEMSELIGKNHFDLFPNRENEVIFRQVRDTGSSAVFRAKPFVYKNQPERGVTYWDWTLAPVKDSSGRVIGLVLSLIDITHRKAIEDALKAAYQKLKKISELKSSILRDVSHELKHPISLITMATNFVEDEIKKGLPDKSKAMKYMDMLRRNAKMFDQKLASILELSRLETVETISTEGISMQEMISEIAKENHDVAMAKGIELRTDTEAIAITANKTMLHSLVNNLVVNAIKYSKKGSVEVTCRKDGNNAVISVKDTGIGIHKDNISKIFEPFFKEDLSSEGVGVGLAICKKVVELHGGSISVQSSLGKGSTFTMTMPLKMEIGSKEFRSTASSA